MLNNIICYFLDNRLVTALFLLLMLVWGIISAPFGWKSDYLPTDPVAVDAIPDYGENQQIVFTSWPGRSPQDVEDQISYPLTTSLLGIPGVKSVRSSSLFGMSSVYIIFEDDVEFYWSRSRILEKLNSLPANLLPEGVQPTLGPDATGLGQVYMYTLEGRDPEGNTTGGWDLHEIRSVQDFYMKYALNAVKGVSEVGSVGGFVQEYQVDVDPDALKTYGIPLPKVLQAVKRSNRDVGAKTIEINNAEYLLRGLGYVKSVEDLEQSVVSVQDNVPIRISDIARVSLGPATRRGVLDKDGAEVVGGVVVARYGANPMEVIEAVKVKIDEIAGGLPKKTLSDGTESQLTVVPYYDRSKLIGETLGTLEEALSLEILITILVVVIMLLNLRASLLISGLLPLSVLMVFIAMKLFDVEANIVALSGIAIAIGTMVDLGVVLSENIIEKLERYGLKNGDAAKMKAKDYVTKVRAAVYEGASEVAPAIITAVATTIVSFIPVFAMEGAEGKLFRPLAFTKTFALLAALLVAVLVLPMLANLVFGVRTSKGRKMMTFNALVAVGALALLIAGHAWAGWSLLALVLAWLLREYSPKRNWWVRNSSAIVAVLSVSYLLAEIWMPLGAGRALWVNALFVGLMVAVVIGFFMLLEYKYRTILGWCMEHKRSFIVLPISLLLLALTIWKGFDSVFGFVAKGGERIGWNIRASKPYSVMNHAFPGIGEEFMPALDEGSFLLMPTSMPHSGIAYNKKVLQQLDVLTAGIPEVELTVGKLGRVESALDPAPISMYENIINYKSEYAVDRKGHRQRFKVDEEDRFVLKNGLSLSNIEALERGVQKEDLLLDEDGQYFRNWRPEIKTADDIWQQVAAVSQIPGVTSAPKLQPIETRLVMLQTGMRAPMGIKVYGPDLQIIEDFGRSLENILKEVPGVKSEAVFAERIVGKPYLQMRLKREAMAVYGLQVEDVQQTLETAVGGMPLTSSVEGRERYAIRVRYPRELRDSPEALAALWVSTPQGAQIPLAEVADFEYLRGPQMIKSEDTFMVGYVLFDKRSGFAELDVVEAAQRAIGTRIESGELEVPKGVNYRFSGNYENQVRASKRLSIIIPAVLLVILLILYMQFRSLSTSLMVFSGVFMAFSGAFILIGLYGLDGFMDFSLFGENMRELFRVQPINLSVAVWVGFIALFGIATDDGVLIASYLDQSMQRNQPGDIKALRAAVMEAGLKRVRPAVITSVTTIIALLPVLSSQGRGAGIMVPMAIPVFGGMVMASITFFVVPVLYCWREEWKMRAEADNHKSQNHED